MVDRNAFPRLGCDKDFVRRLFFAAPRDLGHCAKKTACARGWRNLGELLGDFAVEGKLLELGKR